MESKNTKPFIPPDCESETKKHIEAGGGCCAQACIAVIQRTTIKEVLRRWKKHGLDWKGYTPVTQVKEYLIKEGFSVKLITSKNKTDFKAPFYMIRIQWLGNGFKKEKPFYGHNHWSIATAHTHYILKEGDKFFCNENGWFYSLDDYLLNTEPKGAITSIYEITKQKWNLQSVE